MLLLVGLLADPAAAVVYNFSVSPSDPVMGEIVRYTALDDGYYPTPLTYKWEYKYTSGSCQLDWMLSGFTSEYAEFIESRPGTWDVRLTVEYDPEMMLPPTVITKSVTIAPATHFTTVAGMNTSTPSTSSIVLKFRVDAATRECGWYVLTNLAQEKITQRWNRSPPYTIQYPPDSDWIPDAPVEGFFLQGNEIWDTQYHGLDGYPWDLIGWPEAFMNCTQYLRLKYVDPCGDTKYINLGSHVLEWKKVDSDNWQVSEFFP